MNDPRSARDVPACQHTLLASGVRPLKCVNCGAVDPFGKPSPREVLRGIVAKLTDAMNYKRGLRNTMAANGHPELAVACDAADTAYGEAITLIRSMAGHLMEPTNGE